MRTTAGARAHAHTPTTRKNATETEAAEKGEKNQMMEISVRTKENESEMKNQRSMRWSFNCRCAAKCKIKWVRLWRMEKGGLKATISAAHRYAFCRKLITQTSTVCGTRKLGTPRKKGTTLNFCKRVIIVILSKRYDANTSFSVCDCRAACETAQEASTGKQFEQTASKNKGMCWFGGDGEAGAGAWVVDYITKRILAAPTPLASTHAARERNRGRQVKKENNAIHRIFEHANR